MREVHRRDPESARVGKKSDGTSEICSRRTAEIAEVIETELFSLRAPRLCVRLSGFSESQMEYEAQSMHLFSVLGVSWLR
jgi:hypothetical protein